MIGANATLESGAVIDADAVVPRGAIIAGAVTEPNAPGAILIASSEFIDPNPPEGWTQCAGFTNTPANDVAPDLLDNCLPFDQLRVRFWRANGELWADHYATASVTVTEWPSAGPVTDAPRTVVMAGSYSGSGAFFASTNGRSQCPTITSNTNGVYLSVTEGYVPAMAPGALSPEYELHGGCNAGWYNGLSMVVYR